MFDLFRSRDKAVRILLGVLLGMVGISMLTYLVPNYNTGAGGNDEVVAEIGKDTISRLDVQRLVQNTMKGRQLPPELLPNYLPTLIDNMVTQRALAYEADRLGYQITDAQISAAIQQYIPSLFQDGKFVGKDAYAAMLGQQNLSISDFENDMRRQLLITRLHDVALEGTIVSPLEIEQEYRKKNEKVKVQFVKLTQDKYKAEITPSNDDLMVYFKANAGAYTTPERKNLAILVGDQTRLEQTLNPTDAELQAAYNKNIADYRVPETVKVRHILLKTQGKPAADEAKIKAQADDLLKQVKGGANFADLVKKYSEDTASVPNGGEYSVSRNGQMVKEFEDAAFALKPGESQVVKTTYGYHVFQVMTHDPARVKPFAEAKAELAANYKKQKASDIMQQISDRAQAMLQKDPTHPEKIAADLNMQLVHATNVEAVTNIPDIGPSPDFDTSIASLKKGEVSSPVALTGNKIALAVVEDVQPPRPSTFDEVKDKIKDALVTSRMATAVQKHAQELADKVKNGEDMVKAAKSMGLEAKTSDDITRTGTVEGLGSATYISEAFSRPDGAVLGPIPLSDGSVVVKVLSRSQADMSKLPEQHDSIRDDIKGQKARDRNALFEAGVRDALIKEGKVKIHKDAVDKLIASYRTSS